MRALKVAAINAAVCALLALGLLAALEVYLRLTIPPSSGESIYAYTPATARYKVMKPLARIVAFGQELRTNNLGFRDAADEIPAKREKELRIVVLGDSFTVSAGVAHADIWTTLLERRLRERFGDVRVVNLAVGGYNVIQYALVLKEVGLKLQPDMVLIALFPENDFSLETLEANRRIAQGESPPPEPAWRRLYVYRAYLARLEALLRGALAFGPARAAAHSGAGWEQNVVALRDIVQTARAHRLPVAAVLLPHTRSFDKQRAHFGRVATECRRQQLPCLDLLEGFLAGKASERSLRLNLLDPHPSGKYNAFVAGRLASWLPGVMRASAAN